MRRFPWLVIIILMTIITISIFLTLIRTKHTVTITKVATQQYSTATLIRHVVIIILENHSFDNIYGTYPFGVPPIINNITLSLARPLGLNLSITISGVKPYYANSVILIDPWEGYMNYHIDWDRGAMDDFVKGSGRQSMVYLSYEQVPLLWDYAEEYVLAENFFSPDLATTTPNRISYLVGYPVPAFGSGSGCIVTFNETILYQL